MWGRSVIINIKTVTDSDLHPFTQRLPGTCQGRRKRHLSSLGARSTAPSRDRWGCSLGLFVFWHRYPVPGSGRHSLECEKSWPEHQVQTEAGRGKNEDLRESAMEIMKQKWQNTPEAASETQCLSISVARQMYGPHWKWQSIVEKK